MKYTVIQSNIEKISICLNRGREESVENDVDFGTFIVQSYFDTLLRYVSISDILWSSCFSESYGPKFQRHSLSAEEDIRCV